MVEENEIKKMGKISEISEISNLIFQKPFITINTIPNREELFQYNGTAYNTKICCVCKKAKFHTNKFIQNTAICPICQDNLKKELCGNTILGLIGPEQEIFCSLLRQYVLDNSWNSKLLGIGNAKIVKRFITKLVVSEDGKDCWIWEGCIGKAGYGFIRVKDRNLLTYRLAYSIFVEEIPEGKCVLHTCDIRACCNPDHLWVGTKKDNTQDMVSKGRNGYGSIYGKDNYNSKLAERDIPKIRRMLGLGYSQKHIGDVFGVSDMAINHIKKGKNWKGVGNTMK